MRVALLLCAGVVAVLSPLSAAAQPRATAMPMSHATVSLSGGGSNAIAVVDTRYVSVTTDSGQLAGHFWNSSSPFPWTSPALRNATRALTSTAPTLMRIGGTGKWHAMRRRHTPPRRLRQQQVRISGCAVDCRGCAAFPDAAQALAPQRIAHASSLPIHHAHARMCLRSICRWRLDVLQRDDANGAAAAEGLLASDRRGCRGRAVRLCG